MYARSQYQPVDGHKRVTPATMAAVAVMSVCVGVATGLLASSQSTTGLAVSSLTNVRPAVGQSMVTMPAAYATSRPTGAALEPVDAHTRAHHGQLRRSEPTYTQAQAHTPTLSWTIGFAFIASALTAFSLASWYSTQDRSSAVAMASTSGSKTKAAVPTQPLDLDSLKEREIAIWKLKSFFENAMCEQLNLTKVSAPLILPAGKGINDDLNGVELIASFPVKNMGGVAHELPQSLAKWKRMALKTYDMQPGEGIITHMNAVRPDEDIDVTHSVFVEQWDWERVLTAEDRNIEYLKSIVAKVWAAIKEAEVECERLTGIECILPETLEFVHSEDLERRFPDKTPKEREAIAVKENGGAVFVVGIGAPLPISGELHDGRAPDYDDWITPTPMGAGLNGDILVWHPVLEREFELSSMGVRVDKVALQKELEIRGCPERGELMFQQGIMNDVWPLSIGGGVGQSRLTMFLLRRSHIGETVRTVWPDSEQQACKEKGIKLLAVTDM